MFDALKGLGNLSGLMAKAQEMKDRMKSMQDDLSRREFTADAGQGIVTATVTGKLELKQVRIDKTRVDLGDIALLEDLILAAVNAAQSKAAAMMQSEMQKLTSELGIPPGMI